MSKKALGKGLGALLPDQGDQGIWQEVSLLDIVPNPDQPRREFDAASLADLAESIKVHGLLQPILVRVEGQQFRIIAGERRFRAAQLAGLEKITCMIQDCTAQEMAERALVENIQRSDLSPIDEGFAYKRLMEEYGLTQEQIAQRVGKGRTTIANLLRVVQLPDRVLVFLRDEKISLGHAKLLIGLDAALAVLVAERIAREGLSVRETEELLSRLGETSDKKKTVRVSRSGLPEIEEHLRGIFQTKVRVRGDEVRGKIEIDYYSQDELNRLLELWQVRLE